MSTLCTSERLGTEIQGEGSDNAVTFLRCNSVNFSFTFFFQILSFAFKVKVRVSISLKLAYL